MKKKIKYVQETSGKSMLIAPEQKSSSSPPMKNWK
jgi:hypothetical protein